METVTFTNEALENMKRTLNVVLDDLRNIWSSSSLNEAYIEFEMWKENTKDWTFYINNETIVIFKSGSREKYALEYTTIKGKIKKVKVPERNKMEETRIQNCVFRFLIKYDEIREKLIEKIKENEKSNDNCAKILDDIRAKYSSEVIIDLGLSQTQNNHEIEVIEKDGKNIGIINFGSKIIKIVTDGNITLTKRENPKTKRK